MKELIEKLESKIKGTPTNTSENRRIRGAYTDCLIMVKEAITAIQQSEWISVEQATPHDGMYLCLVEQIQQCGTIWKVQKVMQNLFNNWVVIHNETVTHWMPLPTPPNK